MNTDEALKEIHAQQVEMKAQAERLERRVYMLQDIRECEQHGHEWDIDSITTKGFQVETVRIGCKRCTAFFTTYRLNKQEATITQLCIADQDGLMMRLDAFIANRREEE